MRLRNSGGARQAAAHANPAPSPTTMLTTMLAKRAHRWRMLSRVMVEEMVVKERAGV